MKIICLSRCLQACMIPLIILLYALVQQNDVDVCGECQTKRRPHVVFLKNDYNSRVTHNDNLLVKRVLSRLGYYLVTVNSAQVNVTDGTWDIIWSRKLYRFDARQFKPNQRVNHISTAHAFIIKSHLAQLGSKYLPKTYVMPHQMGEFLVEAQISSNTTLWVQKNVHHRGVVVKHFTDLDLERDDVVVQKFINNQYLLDGRAFNIGIYVLITSVVPFRAYILDNDIVSRMCPKPFNHSNYDDIETYVTDGENAESIAKFTKLERHFHVGYSMKLALDSHLESMTGKHVDIVYDQIYDAVRDVLLKWRKLVPVLHAGSGFFELLRFDFILKEDLGVTLMEANMSPQLEHTTNQGVSIKNQHLVYTALSTLLHQKSAISKSVKDSDIYLQNELCVDPECTNCQIHKCKLCSHCLSDIDKDMLKQSFLEHINMQSFRRVYPEAMNQEFDKSNNDDDSYLSVSDSLNRAWFKAKCIEDEYWCR